MGLVDDSAPRESQGASESIFLPLRFWVRFRFLLIGHISIAAWNHMKDHTAFVTDTVTVLGTLQRYSHGDTSFS
jgi:hypothetical protein